MDIPACYPKHLWMQVLFGTAGEFSLAIRSHYLNVSGNMNLRVTIKELCHPTRSSELLPLLCLLPFYGTSIHPGCLGKYSKINMQVVLRIFYI